MGFRGLHSRLSRQTSSGRFIPEVDGLRFLAISLVVLFHLSGYLAARSPIRYVQAPSSDVFGHFASFGHYGVELFFIISGFVLALPFAAHAFQSGPAVSLRSYFLRRLTRLEPPYIFIMVGCAVLLIVRHRTTVHEILPHLTASLFYFHNLVYGPKNTVNTVAWSLEIEVQFYCLAPALALVFRVADVWTRRAILIVAIIGSLALQPMLLSHGILGRTVLHYSHFFLTGFLAADLYATNHTQWLLRRIQPLGALLRNSWFVTIGGMCYTIYLIHYPFISFIMPYSMRIGASSIYWVHLLIQYIVVGVPLLVISAIFFVLVERPCMDKRWPQELVRRLRQYFPDRDGQIAPFEDAV